MKSPLRLPGTMKFRKSFAHTILFSGLIATMLIGQSCGGGDEEKIDLKHSYQYNMISSVENPAMIFSYDFMTIKDKSGVMSSDKIPPHILALMNEAVNQNASSTKLGIKLEGNNPITIATQDNGEFGYAFLVAEVLNKEKATSTVKTYIKGSVEEENGISYVEQKYGGAAVAWDSLHVVIIGSPNGDIDMKSKAMKLMEARFTDGEDNAELEAYLNRKDDMNMFMFLDNWSEMISKMDRKAEVPEELLALYEGAYMVGSGNFEPGRIIFETNLKADKIKSSEYNMLNKGAISEDYNQYITDGDLIMYGVGSVDMMALFNMLDQNAEFKEEFYGGMSEIGLDEATAKDLLTGEFAFSMIDIAFEEKPSYHPESFDDFFDEPARTEPKPHVVATIGINNTEAMNQLIMTIPGIVNNNGVYNVEEAYFAMSDGKMVITTNEQTAQLFASGAKFKSYPINNTTAPISWFLNTDLNSYPQQMLDELRNEEGGNEIIQLIKEMDNVNFEAGFDGMKFEIQFKNKEDNALKVIVDTFMDKAVSEAMNNFGALM